MSAPAPSDSPASNTRRRAFIANDPQVQQLRTQYPLQLLPTLSDKERREWTARYEQSLLRAATSDSEVNTWLLATLAWDSVCEDTHAHSKYLSTHYLRHLHCITDAHSICKSCRKAYPLADEESDGESESEHERYALGR